MPDLDVIIVGGGIAGLTAAYDLTRAGRTVALLEARTRLGGLVLTERIDVPSSGEVASGDHFLIEAGADALLMQKPAAAELCAELGLHLVPTRTPRTAFVLRDGRLHPISSESTLGIPLTDDAIAASTMLSADGRAALARDLTAPREKPHALEDESIGAFIRRRFGDEAVRYLAQPLLGGIHAGDVDRLSLRALFPALADADAQPGSLLQTLRARRRPASADGAFRTVEGGLGRLIDALADRLPAGTVRLGAEVIRLHADSPCSTGAERTASGVSSAEGAPRWTIDLADGTQLRAACVVLAVPAYVAGALLAQVDDRIAAICSRIPYVSSASISLCYSRDTVAHPLTGTGFVVPPDEPMPLMAVSWVTSKWDGRAPSDVVMLRAFAGGIHDAARVDDVDDALVTVSHDALAPLLGLSARPFFSKVYRWRRAGPQYEPGHPALVRELDDALVGRPGLFIGGCGFRGIGIPDNVAASRRLASSVLAWLDETGAATAP